MWHVNKTYWGKACQYFGLIAARRFLRQSPHTVEEVPPLLNMRDFSMPLATTCRLNKREVDVDDAVELRDEAKRSRQPTLNFRCLDCDEPVRPHRGGGLSLIHI